jgi:hypothetical protein
MMKPIKFRNRKISWNGRGYAYLNLPKQVAKALNCGFVDITILPDGVLLTPKGPAIERER